LPERGGQLYLFPDYKPEIEEGDTVILFHLKKNNKETLADQAKLEGLTVTGLLNALIADYLAKKLEAVKAVVKKTGRGNIDRGAIEKLKELMRNKAPEGVRLQDIAEYVGCSNARARGLIDLVSDVWDSNTDFLVYESEKKPTRYFIYRDGKEGGR